MKGRERKNSLADVEKKGLNAQKERSSNENDRV